MDIDDDVCITMHVCVVVLSDIKTCHGQLHNMIKYCPCIEICGTNSILDVSA